MTSDPVGALCIAHGIEFDLYHFQSKHGHIDDIKKEITDARRAVRKMVLTLRALSDSVAATS